MLAVMIRMLLMNMMETVEALDGCDDSSDHCGYAFEERLGGGLWRAGNG